MKENAVIQEVHISQISAGDSIFCNDGHVRTICKKDIKRSGFFVGSIFGDSYKNGEILVKRVKFEVPTNNGIVLR